MISYKYKLYTSKRNRYLDRQVNVSCWIYNHCIALHKRYYKLTGKYLNKSKLQKHLTKLKKLDKHKKWNTVGSQAIQDITDRIDRAYKLFFRNLKYKIRTAPPGFRKRIKYHSFTLKQAGYKFGDDNSLIINGREYKFHKSRGIPKSIKTLTVKRDKLGHFYIYITSNDKPDTLKYTTGKSVGIDFGLKTFAKTSDLETIESPQVYKKKLKVIAKANRNLARKKKGSNNRKRTKLELIRAYKKIANKRRDWLFKTALELCKDFDKIYLEDLEVKSWAEKWGRKTNDLSIAEFVKLLSHMAGKYGAEIIFRDKYFPSTQLCHKCSFRNRDLDLSVRQWQCPECGIVLDRDFNAALNLLLGGTSSNAARETVKVSRCQTPIIGASCA